MTQWIFRSDLCGCQRSDDGWSLAAGSPDSDDGPELELDPSTFPVERYKPLRELGSGASGTVYGCRDRLLGKLVAVKILRKLTAEQLVAFQNEARATSKLNHPAILKLLDFGPTDSGIPYMVLEYFNSITLGEYIEERGPLEIPQFLHVFLPIVAALGVAHSSGIFHRDLKPSNILISRCERTESGAPAVKLIDFGVAQVKQDTYPSIVIQGQTIAGTPGYMSPDMITGKAYDERSEIYSLGCVMFESLTGFNPFRADTAMESFALQSQIESPLLSDYLDKTFPEELEAFIARCLAREPEERFDTMGDVEERLNEIEWKPKDSQSSTPAEFRSPRSHNKLVTSIAVGIVLLSVSMGVYFFNRLADPPVDRKMRIESVPAVTFDSGSRPIDDISERFAEKENATNIELLARAKNGDATAQYQLGQECLRNQNAPEALKWLTKSSAAGYPAAKTYLGRIYERGWGTPVNPKKAFSLFSEAARAGDQEGQNCLGCVYYRGFGTPVDYKKAFYWFNESRQRYNDRALARIGVLYQQGRGVKKDLNRAASIFLQTAERGCGVGQYCLGFTYEYGLGLDRSDSDARRWYTESTTTTRSISTAHMRLGRMDLFKPDSEGKSQAAWHFENAVNDPDAEFYLGAMYALGQGVRQRDYKSAVEWFSRAAGRAEPDAELCLAYLHFNGLGVAKNVGQAKSWLTKASEDSKGKISRNTDLNSVDIEKLMVKHDVMSLDSIFVPVGREWM